jgi:hypothetical protein
MGCNVEYLAQFLATYSFGLSARKNSEAYLPVNILRTIPRGTHGCRVENLQHLLAILLFRWLKKQYPGAFDSGNSLAVIICCAHSLPFCERSNIMKETFSHWSGINADSSISKYTSIPFDIAFFLEQRSWILATHSVWINLSWNVQCQRLHQLYSSL